MRTDKSALRYRYQLPNPITGRPGSAAISGDQLESILESGFQTIADAIRDSGLSVDSSLSSSPNLEQGVVMDDEELWDIDLLDINSSGII